MPELLIAIGVVLSIGSWVLGIRHRAKARSLETTNPNVLEVGKRCRLSGEVDAPEDGGYAVRVTLFQTNHTDFENGEVPQWRDRRVEVETNPFVLLLDDGQRVQCKLAGHVGLHDAAVLARKGRPIELNKTTRNLERVIKAGDLIHVEGTLAEETTMEASDYRGGVQSSLFLTATKSELARVFTTPSLKERLSRHTEFGFLLGLNGVLMALVWGSALLVHLSKHGTLVLTAAQSDALAQGGGVAFVLASCCAFGVLKTWHPLNDVERDAGV